MFVQKMADKYYRLVCFVMNICPEPLREFFIRLANNDAGSSYTTLDAYLAHRQLDVMQLKIKRRIREDQYNLLYPGQGNVDEKQWDVTLLVALITELFAASLQQHDIYLMKNEIRGIRNELQHLPNTSNISDEAFDNYWQRLETASMTIAKQVFSAEHEELFRKKISNAKCNNLPNLGDSLRQWYEEIIKQMQNKLNKVESNTKETTSVLRQVTVQKPGPSGETYKRLKTTDGVLANLQASFETTMKELPDNFNEPVEVVADIRTKLRNNHHVIVTGSYNSRYFETALVAIKGMDYNHKRCVEMHTSSNWYHIDPCEVDLVLCKNPFGSYPYDENKAKSMADIFDSMIQSTKGAGDKTLDIIIVADFNILKECKKFHDHDILEGEVNVIEVTSTKCPADLTLGCGNQNVYSTCLPVVNNLGVVTSYFLKQYTDTNLRIEEDIIKEAKYKFKKNKAIVLTGPKKSGKTSVAAALASSYETSKCLLFKRPNDFNKIDFQNVCLVIIDEFAGKYRYEESDVYRWYSMFDHLYSIVTSGKMNVIITCESNKLDKCLTEISQHPILDHRVEMQEGTVVFKQKISQLNTKNSLSTGEIDGGIDTDTITVKNEEAISGEFNTINRTETPTTTQGLLLPDRTTAQFNSLAGIPASVQNVKATNLQPSSGKSIQFGPPLSTERGEVDDRLSNIQRIQSATHTQTSIPSVQTLTGSHVWSVKDKRMFNIRVNGDRGACYIRGSCLLPSGEILLADYNNHRLKKLNYKYKGILTVCDLSACPQYVCYIGNNVAVVALASEKLQFVDIRGEMTLTRSVDTGHFCSGVAYCDNQLYVIDKSSVYIYSIDGTKQNVLYTHLSGKPYFLDIALSDDGSKIYIVDWARGLVIIDISGYHLYTDSELNANGGVCVDDEGHVLVSCFSSKEILQFSSDGKQKIGIIANEYDGIDNTRTLSFDKENSALVAAGYGNNTCVLNLQ